MMSGVGLPWFSVSRQPEGVDNEDCALIHCLQASQASALRELSKREREAVLGQFVADGWLAAVPDRPGCYTLGVR